MSGYPKHHSIVDIKIFSANLSGTGGDGDRPNIANAVSCPTIDPNNNNYLKNENQLDSDDDELSNTYEEIDAHEFVHEQKSCGDMRTKSILKPSTAQFKEDDYAEQKLNISKFQLEI